jgi:hypothetical protein
MTTYSHNVKIPTEKNIECFVSIKLQFPMLIYIMDDRHEMDWINMLTWWDCEAMMGFSQVYVSFNLDKFADCRTIDDVVTQYYKP